MRPVNWIQDEYRSAVPRERYVGLVGKTIVEVITPSLLGLLSAGGLALLDDHVHEIAVFRSPVANAGVVAGIVLLFVRWFKCDVIREDGRDRPPAEGRSDNREAGG